MIDILPNLKRRGFTAQIDNVKKPRIIIRTHSVLVICRKNALPNVLRAGAANVKHLDSTHTNVLI